MNLIETHDKQIENAAKSIKTVLVGSARSEKDARNISDQIDRIEKELKILNRMTGGQFGLCVNSLR